MYGLLLLYFFSPVLLSVLFLFKDNNGVYVYGTTLFLPTVNNCTPTDTLVFIWSHGDYDFILVFYDSSFMYKEVQDHQTVQRFLVF